MRASFAAPVVVPCSFDSHPDGLVLTQANPGPRFGRAKELGRVLAIVAVLLASVTFACLLALFD